MLNIGIELTLEAERDGGVKKYKSKVADVSEASVSIYYPLSIPENKPAFLPVGSKVTVHFVDEQSNFIKFESEVTGIQKNNVPLMVLSFPGASEFKKVQRREHVRVDVSVEMTVTLPKGECFSEVTENISAGGCALKLPENIQLKPGEKGSVVFSIEAGSGKQEFTLPYEVVRVFAKDNHRLASLKYIDPGSMDVQFLTRFCFEKQLENRKKGLLA